MSHVVPLTGGAPHAGPARAAALRAPALLVAALLAGAVLDAAAAGAAPPGAAPPGPAAPAAADTLPSYQGTTILVEGERWRRPWIPMAGTVLERPALERAGVLRLSDALRPVTGLRVARYGGVGALAPISIRGGSNEQALVLVDGRRLTTAEGGGVDLGGLDPAAIERVEVLRGAASALHGSDALGGVIAITTRPEAVRRTAELHLETGSLATAAGSLRLELPAGRRARLWLRGHGLTSDGGYEARDVERASTGRRRNADLEAGGLLAGLELRPTPASTVILDGALSRSDQGVPGPLEFPTPHAERHDRAASLALDWQLLDHAGGPSRLRLSSYARRQRRHYRDPDQRIDDRHENRALGVGGQLDRTGGGGRTWSLLFEGRQDRLESNTEGRARRLTGAVAGRLRRNWQSDTGAGRELGIAVRLDALSDFAPFWSARLGVAWTDGGRRRWRLGAARAFRAPGFQDLFLRDIGTARGNPQLDPERAFEVDGGLTLPLGARGPLRQARLEVDLFWNSIADLIQWVPGVDAVWRPHNVGLAILRGAELEGTAQLAGVPLAGPLELRVNASLLDARDRSGAPNLNGRRLVYRPHARGTVELGGPLAGGRWRWDATWLLTSSSFITAANTKRMPGYGLLEARLETTLDRRAALELAVLNVTGQAATDIRDYPLPGREWRLGLRLPAGGGAAAPAGALPAGAAGGAPAPEERP